MTLALVPLLSLGCAEKLHSKYINTSMYNNCRVIQLFTGEFCRRIQRYGNGTKHGGDVHVFTNLLEIIETDLQSFEQRIK